MKILLISIALCCLINFSNCNNTTYKCKNAVEAKIVDMSGLDGCKLMLQLKNGDRLEFINAQDFPDFSFSAGKLVNVNFEETGGIASICKAGKIVKINCIEER